MRGGRGMYLVRAHTQPAPFPQGRPAGAPKARFMCPWPSPPPALMGLWPLPRRQQRGHGRAGAGLKGTAGGEGTGRHRAAAPRPSMPVCGDPGAAASPPQPGRVPRAARTSWGSPTSPPPGPCPASMAGRWQREAEGSGPPRPRWRRGRGGDGVRAGRRAPGGSPRQRLLPPPQRPPRARRPRGGWGRGRVWCSASRWGEFGTKIRCFQKESACSPLADATEIAALAGEWCVFGRNQDKWCCCACCEVFL